VHVLGSDRDALARVGDFKLGAEEKVSDAEAQAVGYTAVLGGRGGKRSPSRWGSTPRRGCRSSAWSRNSTLR